MRGTIPTRPRRSATTVEASVAAAADLEAHAGIEGQAIADWWRQRADDAIIALLRLDRRRLLGTAITAQTGTSLRLTAKRLHTVDHVSPDGLHFPIEPSEFKDEVLRQAREMYSGRSGLRMDLPRLHGGITASTLYSGDSPSQSKSCSVDHVTLLPAPLSCLQHTLTLPCINQCPHPSH